MGVKKGYKQTPEHVEKRVSGRRRLIPKEELEIMYVSEGKSSREIGKELGCEKSIVLRRLADAGIPRRPAHALSPEDGMTRAKRHYEKKKDDPGWISKQRESNKKSLIKNRGKYRKAMRDERLLFLFSYQAQIGCEKCGETNPIVLQFHHRAGEEKLFNVGDSSTKERKWDILLKELEKCDVLCANCHRLLHWDEMHDEDINWTPKFHGAGKKEN
jgi:hypothetical protein